MTLLELADRCEKAIGPDREMDALIEAHLDGYSDIEERNGWMTAWNGDRSRTLGMVDPSASGKRNFTPQSHMTPAHTASLDAAMTLVPEWSKGVTVVRGESGRGAAYIDKLWCAGSCDDAASPALALCAAALRARAGR